MGIDFFVGEMQSQANEASRMAREANQAVSLMEQSIQQFLSAPLSSKTYDTAKRYFAVAYSPLGKSVVMVGEALTTAHQRMIRDFQGMVGGSDIQEEVLKSQIQQWEQLKYQLSLQIDQAKEWKPDLERRYMKACDTVRRIQERLEKLYAYNAHSASIFSEFYASLSELDAGLSAIESSGAWNPSSGTFDIGRLNMTWTKPIQERWQKREQQLKAAKDKEVKKALGKLDGYTIVCTNLGSSKEWYLMKNGKILPPKDYPELYRQLDKCKDGLNKDRYRVEEIKVVKNEVPLSLILGGPLGAIGNVGKIGQGIDTIRKGLGIVKVGQSIINQMQSAPSLSLTKELEISEEGWDGQDTNLNDVDLDNLPEGWSKTDNNGHVHVRDAEGNLRIRKDPADGVTNYEHKHYYDKNKTPLDKYGNPVDRKNPDSHIPID